MTDAPLPSTTPGTDEAEIAREELAPQHTFQVLTKRAKRMQEYVSAADIRLLNVTPGGHPNISVSTARAYHSRTIVGAPWTWPLPNVWLGVSAERQQEADERIPYLLATPAAVRWVSAEPLLGPIDLNGYLYLVTHGDDVLLDSGFTDPLPFHDPATVAPDAVATPRLDWIVAGGESGAGARPMHPDWARGLRDQCAAAGVPFFFKQWGNWASEIDRDRDDPDWRRPYSNYQEPHFQILNAAGGRGFHGERVHVMRLCSKKSAGRLLDGIEHNGMPERAA